MKVVYVAGLGRSGSTLLDRIVGEMPEFTSLGEFRDVSDGKPLSTHLCACGLAMPDCPFWGDIMADVLDSIGVDSAGLHELLRSTSRQRYLPRLLVEQRKGSEGHSLPGYARYLHGVYERVVERSGRPSIMDSSKSPSDVLLLANHPDVELHLVHLVRDPRAAAFSWSRPKGDPGKGGDTIPIYSPLVSSRKWLGHNLAIEMFLHTVLRERYQLVRYEDLMADPHAVLRRIVTGFGSDPSSLPLVGERAVQLGPCHAVGGNPMRFSNGMMTLELDARWMAGMAVSDRVLATLPTLPLLYRYRYPFWTGGPARSNGSVHEPSAP
jgi:hypothetical protein